MAERYVGRMKFGNLTRNERYRRRLNAFVSDDEFADDVTVFIDFEDGSNGNADATDTSQNTHTITWQNGATVSEAEKKFGTLSLDIIGTTEFIDIAETADGVLGRSGPTDFGAGDFTIELHVRASTSAGADQIVTVHPDGEEHVGILMSNNNLFIEYSTDGTTTVQTDSGHNLSDATWQHLALVRNGNDLDLYMDGVKGTTTVDVTGLTLHALTDSAIFRIGGNAAGSAGFEGYVDSIRVTKGVARYRRTLRRRQRHTPQLQHNGGHPS